MQLAISSILFPEVKLLVSRTTGITKVTEGTAMPVLQIYTEGENIYTISQSYGLPCARFGGDNNPLRFKFVVKLRSFDKLNL